MFFWNSCFFDDPTDVGILISGSSVFSKTSLNIWKFTVHLLLKPGLENFEHYFTSVWDELDVAIMYKALKFHKTLPDSSLLETCKWKLQWGSYHLTLVRLTITTKPTNKKYWRGCGQKRTLLHWERDGNTRPPDLPPEKSVCRSRGNSKNWTWNNRLVPNQERSTSRLYIVILHI